MFKTTIFIKKQEDNKKEKKVCSCGLDYESSYFFFLGSQTPFSFQKTNPQLEFKF